MENLILIGLCLCIGVLLQRLSSLPANAPMVLNQLILYVILPAVALVNIPFIDWNLKLISLCLMPWLTFALAYLLFNFLGKKFNWPSSLIGCLILTAGFGNTSFVGFPIIEALFGKDALPYAVLVDQPGTFLICSTFGVLIASQYSYGKMPLRNLIKKILTFPFFIAFFIAILLGFFHLGPSGVVKDILGKLAAMLTPIALISVGLQLKWGHMWPERRNLSVGLGYKLIFCPLLIFCLYRFLNLPPLIFKVAVMEAAMAPMITSSILAGTHNLEPRLASMMVGVGIPLSFLTLGFWYFVF
jgi:predicted permease